MVIIAFVIWSVLCYVFGYLIQRQIHLSKSEPFEIIRDKCGMLLLRHNGKLKTCFTPYNLESTLNNLNAKPDLTIDWGDNDVHVFTVDNAFNVVTIEENKL